jgi:hypothetical protein
LVDALGSADIAEKAHLIPRNRAAKVRQKVKLFQKRPKSGCPQDFQRADQARRRGDDRAAGTGLDFQRAEGRGVQERAVASVREFIVADPPPAVIHCRSGVWRCVVQVEEFVAVVLGKHSGFRRIFMAHQQVPDSDAVFCPLQQGFLTPFLSDALFALPAQTSAPMVWTCHKMQ